MISPPSQNDSRMPPTLQKPKRPNLDSVTTINRDGSHHILHPADVRGFFTRWRRAVGAVLIAVYVALPWISINGAPALFFDVEHRRFHAFGITLLAQDLWVLFFAVSGLGFLLFFVTAVLGRIWCGWACPYPVFLEHVFRRVERWIDGDAGARRRLENAPWGLGKVSRRVAKNGIYLLLSALIAHVFLSYFVSLPRLYRFMKEGPLEHFTAFGIVAFLTGSLFFCFAWFREQFCIIICPYGRIQSALTDDDTVVIGYDAKRGEPRGKATNPDAGDCVDCRRCVSVCPTGIDIRNGLQMECIGCAACIDACDDIMTKLKRPEGLIRYDSSNGLAGRKRKLFRPRLYVYSLLGALGMGALGLTAYHRAKPVHAEVSRMRGASFYVDEAAVRNHYQLRLVNKRNQAVDFTISLENAAEGFTLSGANDPVRLGALEEGTRPLVILNTREHYRGPARLEISIHAEPGGTIIRQSIDFLGPNPHSLKQ